MEDQNILPKDSEIVVLAFIQRIQTILIKFTLFFGIEFLHDLGMIFVLINPAERPVGNRVCQICLHGVILRHLLSIKRNLRRDLMGLYPLMPRCSHLSAAFLIDRNYQICLFHRLVGHHGGLTGYLNLTYPIRLKAAL